MDICKLKFGTKGTKHHGSPSCSICFGKKD